MTALGALTPVSEAADAPAIVEQLTQEEIARQESGKDPAWVDTSHRFATDRTLALTRWVDSFFGDVEEYFLLAVAASVCSLEDTFGKPHKTQEKLLSRKKFKPIYQEE